MSILAALTPAALAGFFDARTLARGFEYARSGRVGEPELVKLTETTATATATVSGAAPAPYAVNLYAEYVDDQFWMTTTCSCPVHIDCKHGVALATTLCSPQERPPTEPAPWHRALDEALRDLVNADRVASRTSDPVPLALEIGLEDSWRHRRYRTTGDPRTPVLRPMRLGARGAWVKTGAEWSSLNAAATRARHPADQVDALLDLLSALQAQDPYWRHSVGSPALAGFGHRLVPLLHRAVAAGVTLVPGNELDAVALLRDPRAVVCDVTRDGEERPTLHLGVTHAGRLWQGDDVVVIGAPAHAVALLGGRTLTLAATTRPVPSAVVRLLDADITVPADDAARLDDYLRPLSRALDLTSSDGSMELPEPIRPLLGLEVRWRSSTDAELTWSWRYGDRCCRLDGDEPLGGLRDRDAERLVRARVPAELLKITRATGGDALALALHDLPSLRELDDVMVVEEQRPEFRESDQGPEISFDLLPPPPAETDTHTDWLDLEVTITVEGERLRLPDVLRALTLGEEFLVLPSGLYLRTDRPELERLRDAVRSAGELRESDGETVSVGRHDLGVWAQLAELGLVDAQAGEWVRRARALRDLADLPRPEPSGLTAELRPYQRDGFHWLAFLWEHRLGGILADDMGLGKTLQVLALIAHATTCGERRPFLVVAPTSVVTAWESEAARHTPGLRVRTARRRADDISALAADADVVVTTYALIRLAQDRYAGVAWGGMVLDEAQQVKNHRSKTYGAVRLVDAPFRLAVTGTPFENRLMELWSLLSIVTPGLYPWPRSFTRHVVRPVESAGDEGALRRFRQRIRPFMMRRTKELVAADLPPKQEQVLRVELAPKHRRIYDTHLAKERQRILGLVDDFEENRIAIFAALTRLRQLALDPGLVDADHDAIGSAKVDLLVEHLLEIFEEGHRALVFSQFTSFLGRVGARLEEEGIASTYLDGSTRDRAAVIEQFRSGAAPVFLISLKAGGVGLTLTEADYVFVLDPWWNPATEAQAVDRAHRIGQTRPVHVYRLIAEETIEEKVMELKGRKAELFANVVDGDGSSAAGITADDIRSLFDG
ncbi:DEAD/DEAH box helicase [Nocardioides sp. YIM 152315]|uniref:DEAD/DEAH box helicase n=1 Tax=Nocardioides sp. YIM 152315 TaxID=3031760 RepID=UPI0023DC879B|nr:DEAD/DEAH box helicase [Nocardioides sp. YIM 152315]MDF1603771.1 DEAD/DEAH box helicase [Nocardioides sp. YIM 152315]